MTPTAIYLSILNLPEKHLAATSIYGSVAYNTSSVAQGSGVSMPRIREATTSGRF